MPLSPEQQRPDPEVSCYPAAYTSEKGRQVVDFTQKIFDSEVEAAPPLKYGEECWAAAEVSYHLPHTR